MSSHSPHLNIHVRTAVTRFHMARLIFRIRIAKCQLAGIHVQQLIARRRNSLLYLRDIIVMITCGGLLAAALIVAYVYTLNHMK